MDVAKMPPAEYGGYWDLTKAGLDDLATVYWSSMKKGLTAGFMTIGFLRLFNFRWFNKHRAIADIGISYTGLFAGAVLAQINNADLAEEIERANKELRKVVEEKIGVRPICYANKKICFLADNLIKGKEVPSEVIVDKGSFANEKITICLTPPVETYKGPSNGNQNWAAAYVPYG